MGPDTPGKPAGGFSCASPYNPPMPALPNRFPGAIRLFRFAGIDVFLHWTWALIAIVSVQARSGAYHSEFWNVAEYLTLFAIVLTHEFGHALACRSVGGRADRILLWPLGGVAYVDPPRRPGAVLWSIAAGPLVNVALIPITLGALAFAPRLFPAMSDDFADYLLSVATINIFLLVFNLLPIYPLDGGQILQSILWFFIGLPKSLAVASVVGIIGAAAVIVLAIASRDMWLIILAVFGISQSLKGLRSARALAAVHRIPRRDDARCPHCREFAPAGAIWRCRCGGAFDALSPYGQCPRCGSMPAVIPCPFCNESEPPSAWRVTPATTRVEWARVVDN
jgi:Zn-dependent protease